MRCIMMHAALNVTTHGTKALTKGLCVFPKQTRQCGSVRIYLDLQLILALMVREYYLRMKYPLDGSHAMVASLRRNTRCNQLGTLGQRDSSEFENVLRRR